ncbi:MAG: hypothetical protein JSV06_09575, partial [Myxococcales bacterium]
MKTRGALLALATCLVAAPAGADAVVVTRAMTANTIMEAFVEEDHIAVELEVGQGDVDAMRALLDAAAETLPTPVPPNAELVIRANGRALAGTIETRVLRKRVERDEITGEPLPKPGSEDVVYLELRYPLDGEPEELIIEPPLTDGGYPATDIGFVVYHQGIAVNDFRYLGAKEPLQLDWNDSFYSRFERRTLNRRYGSPMNVFLYVEPFEVRKEFVVRPLDLARFTDLDVEPHRPIPAAERDALLQRIADFLKDRAPVTVDGAEPEPILDRIHFLKRGLRMTRVVTPDEPIDGTSAIVGAIFVYPIEGMPQEVHLTWDLFDERVDRVPAAATDEAGPMPSYLTPDDPELRWINFLKGGVLPGELPVQHLESRISLSVVFVLAVLVSLVVLGIAVQRRSWGTALTAVAIVGAGWLAPPLRTFDIPVPTGVRTPSPVQAAPTIHALLYNTYRALDFRDEEVVFDRLAQSLSGDVL